MNKILKKFFSILNKKEKIFLILFIPLTLILFVIELLSLGLIIPIVSLLVDGNPFANLNFFRENASLLEVYDTLKQNYSLSVIITYLLALYIIIFIIKNLYILFYNWINFGFSNSVQFRVSSELFNNYIKYDYLKFSNINSSTLMNNILSETASLRNLIRNLISFSSELLIVIGIAVLIFIYDLKAATFATLTMVISSLIYFFVLKKKMIKLGYDRHKMNKILIKNILQSFSGFKIIKILKKEDYFTNNHNTFFSNYLKNNRLLSLIGVLPRLWVEIFALLSICLFVFVLINSEGYSINNLIPFLSLVALSTIRIIPSINKIILAVQSLRSGTVSIDVLYKDLIEEKFKNLDEVNNDETIFNSTLEFKNISFKYPSRSETIINDLSVKIEKGQLIGLIGQSGSGKSTFADIISGLIVPDQGEILVDNKNSKLNSYDWRKKIGYVTQDTFLLDDSIKNNIAIGIKDEDIDEKDINEVLKIVHLDEFINTLPDGIHTVVGEKGLKISGGQRQRIGIARALFRRPEFLILDEPTSALDKENSIKIYQLLIDINKRNTIIVISHNLYFKEKFDQVLEMNNTSLD